ncbi:MAG: anaerobic ribonucleoside-triphosphate reductase [Phycisphaerales bacterium]|nr:anaerobic ribonucleoside-triphosphate reductase [Phycisphaerales bacterium]
MSAALLLGGATVVAAVYLASQVFSTSAPGWGPWATIAGMASLVIAPVGLLWGWCWLVDAIAHRMTPRPHTCRACGYDLMGLGPIERCPECGRKFVGTGDGQSAG